MASLLLQSLLFLPLGSLANSGSKLSSRQSLSRAKFSNNLRDSIGKTILSSSSRVLATTTKGTSKITNRPSSIFQRKHVVHSLVSEPVSSSSFPTAFESDRDRKAKKFLGFELSRYGCFFMTHALTYGLLWYASLVKWLFLSWISRGKWDPDYHNMDRGSLLWARRTLSSTNCLPVVTGLENLPKEHGGYAEDDGKPLMIVANHASWMDVPVIRQITKRCKFLAKKDLGVIPILGTSMRWGHHPLVDRSDKKSTVKAFRQGVEWLKKGVSLVTFPEGTRSLDGRLASPDKLKGGAFKMAIYSGAKVVPVSISGTFDIMPKTALLPLRAANGDIRVHIHPAIDTKNMNEEELTLATHEAIKSGLPLSQRPLGY